MFIPRKPFKNQELYLSKSRGGGGGQRFKICNAAEFRTCALSVQMQAELFWRSLHVNVDFKQNFHSSASTNAAAVDKSLLLSIFAQTVDMASLFKFPSQCKTCSLAPLLHRIWARWQAGMYSSLQASLFCTILTAARVLHVSLTTEKDEERGGFTVWRVQHRWL